MAGQPVRVRQQFAVSQQGGQDVAADFRVGGVVGAGSALDAATRGLKVALVEARDFVTRWLTGPAQGGQGEEAATALLLLHAAAAETGRAVELATTQGPFNLLCGRYRTAAFFDGTLRGSLCTAADKLRSAPPASLAESQERAREIYRLLAEQTAVFKR